MAVALHGMDRTPTQKVESLGFSPIRGNHFLDPVNHCRAGLHLSLIYVFPDLATWLPQKMAN